MSAIPAIEDIRARLLEMLDSASRHVDVLAVQLEPLLLDDSRVTQALTRLARRGRNTRIRIIISDLRAAIDNGHKLLALSRRLPTAMSVHVLREHTEWPGDTLIVCDRSEGLWVNLSERRWRHLDSPGQTKSEIERFDRLWLASAASPELRQF